MLATELESLEGTLERQEEKYKKCIDSLMSDTEEQLEQKDQLIYAESLLTQVGIT